MAKMVQAVQKFGPKVVYGPTAKIDELAGWMARSSGLNPHAARMALGELSDAILFYLRRGSPVTLPGLGRFRVTVGRFGELSMHILPERAFLRDVRDARRYVGFRENLDRAVWTDADYKTAWDTEFPDDPLELTASDQPGEPTEPGQDNLAQAA